MGDSIIGQPMARKFPSDFHFFIIILAYIFSLPVNCIRRKTRTKMITKKISYWGHMLQIFFMEAHS